MYGYMTFKQFLFLILFFVLAFFLLLLFYAQVLTKYRHLLIPLSFIQEKPISDEEIIEINKCFENHFNFKKRLSLTKSIILVFISFTLLSYPYSNVLSEVKSEAYHQLQNELILERVRIEKGEVTGEKKVFSSIQRRPTIIYSNKRTEKILKEIHEKDRQLYIPLFFVFYLLSINYNIKNLGEYYEERRKYLPSKKLKHYNRIYK